MDDHIDEIPELPVIATILLPLPFMTGFFSQNFVYMVVHVISGESTFWVIGVGSMVATCVGLLICFRRKDWV